MARTPKKQTKKEPLVWRFIEYDARWGDGSPVVGELKVKQPQYLKLYLNGWDGPGGEVLRAMEVLNQYDNAVWLEGALWRLLRYSTNTSPQYRGYLLNGRKEPATASDIGRIVRVDGRGSHSQARAFLLKLSRAGFLERVPWPSSSANPIVDNVTPLSKDVTRSKKGGKRQKKPPAVAENDDSAFKGNRKTKNKRKINREGKAENQAKGQDQTVPKVNLEPRRRNESEDEYVNRHKREIIAQLNHDGQAATPSEPCPPATPAIDSTTNRDEGGACHQDSRVPRPVDFTRRRETVGRVVRLPVDRYPAEAWDIADRVIQSIGYIEQDAPAMANERARWAAAWSRIMEDANIPDLDRLAEQLMAKARMVRGIRQTKDNPESYLLVILRNLVKDVYRKQKARGA